MRLVQPGRVILTKVGCASTQTSALRRADVTHWTICVKSLPYDGTLLVNVSSGCRRIRPTS